MVCFVCYILCAVLYVGVLCGACCMMCDFLGVCFVWFVVCGVFCAKYGVAGGVWYVVCGVLNVCFVVCFCGVWYVVRCLVCKVLPGM